MFRRESPLTGASNAGEVGRNRDSEALILSLNLASLCAVNTATGQVSSTRHRRTIVPQVVTCIAGNKRRSLLIPGDDEMFMTRSRTSKSYFYPFLLIFIERRYSNSVRLSVCLSVRLSVTFRYQMKTA